MEAITLAIWNDASDNHGNLWTIYILVVSAVLGFSYSEHFSRIVSECKELAWITLLVLAIFMLSNIYSLDSNFDVLDNSRVALIDIVEQKHNTKEPFDISKIKTAISTTERERGWVLALHGALDLFILWGIYVRIRRAT